MLKSFYARKNRHCFSTKVTTNPEAFGTKKPAARLANSDKTPRQIMTREQKTIIKIYKFKAATKRFFFGLEKITSSWRES